jgi:hypothetical protein
VVLSRRELLLGIGALGVSCTGRAEAPARVATPLVSGPVELWSFFDLPADDRRSRELSGIAWDPRERTLWAVQDETPTLVALVPDRDLRAWQFGPTITIDVGSPVDFEGLVIVPGGFIVCSEEGPRVVEVDRQGKLRRDIALPARFRDARTNKSLESLTVSPSGRYLFTTSESALERDGDGATPQAGTRIRILRLDRESGAVVSEHVYETDPLPYERGDWGVSDLAALSDDELFVLERGWAKGHGNTARIYHTALDAKASCLGTEELGPTLPVLRKTLRVDLGKIDAHGIPEAKQPQASPLLDNYEGIAIGPRLADGRPSLIVVSDDNGRDYQVARVLVLAV